MSRRFHFKSIPNLRTKVCPICHEAFDTHYERQRYCGSFACLKAVQERKQAALKARRAQRKRSKQTNNTTKENNHE